MAEYASDTQTKLAVLEVVLVTPPCYYAGMAKQQLAHKASIARKCASRDSVSLSFEDWQDLIREVIRLFSPVGGVVLDPFVGTGTTTTVANRLGRQWIGIDNNPAHTEIASQRTNEA